MTFSADELSQGPVPIEATEMGIAVLAERVDFQVDVGVRVRFRACPDQGNVESAAAQVIDQKASGP